MKNIDPMHWLQIKAAFNPTIKSLPYKNPVDKTIDGLFCYWRHLQIDGCGMSCVLGFEYDVNTKFPSAEIGWLSLRHCDPISIPIIKSALEITSMVIANGDIISGFIISRNLSWIHDDTRSIR